MADYWLHRLVVQGSHPDVAAFRRATTANRTSRSDGSRLSFRRLVSILPSGAAIDENLLWVEPLALVVDPTSKLENGMVKVAYHFQLNKVEFEPLLVEVSRIYPRLCFILGTLFPAGDQQESYLVHNGRMQVWTLPGSQKERIFAAVPEDSDETSGDDEVFQALIEADWAMMDAVMDHWVSTAEERLAAIAADMSDGGPDERIRPTRRTSRRG